MESDVHSIQSEEITYDNGTKGYDVESAMGIFGDIFGYFRLFGVKMLF